MLTHVKKLLGYKIQAVDGEIGKVEDLYFDAHDWVLRYLVVDTGPWILGRKVLLTHHALQQTDGDDEIISVNLTREQVKNSPEMDSVKMISRPQEEALHVYYGWPTYWYIPPTAAGGGPVAPVWAVPSDELPHEEKPEVVETKEPHLYQFSDVKGYRVHAVDGDIGHVEDFVVEDQDWTIGYFIVDTGGWFQKGNLVMLAPHWITQIDTEDAKVYIDLKKETIRSSPEFEAERVMEND